MEFNENHLREMTETAERAKSNTHRIEEVEEDIKSLKNDNRTLYEMSANIKSLTDGVISIKSDIKDVKEDQGEMKNEIQELKLAPTRTKANWFDSVAYLYSSDGTVLANWDNQESDVYTATGNLKDCYMIFGAATLSSSGTALHTITLTII